jgi:hypothetical protein
MKAAIEQFGITDPQQRRLIAQPVEQLAASSTRSTRQ